MNRSHQIGLSFYHGLWLGALSMLLLLTGLIALARADWSLIGGAGTGNFAWCGGATKFEGCWRQTPLPFEDDRRPTSYLFGAEYRFSPRWAIQGLYHHFTPVRVAGTYVSDEDYNATAKSVRPGAPRTSVALETHTDGISLSILPVAHFGQSRLFGRAGVFIYEQSTDFSLASATEPFLRESGKGFTWMLGMGIGHTFQRLTLAAEVMAFQQVKFEDAPVGGDWRNCKDFGLVSYMLTAAYRL